ncbi:MAG: manganese efflux pump [Ruminococcus sp.]|nr:manganese efflux pump [Ruminococcus sp.]
MLEEAMLSIALCMDIFITSIVYGASGIKISVRSGIILSGVGAIALCLSMVISEQVQNFISADICRYGGVIILSALGGASIFKSLASYVNGKKKEADNKGFLAICVNEESADADKSKTLSGGEAFLLSMALSADSIAGGFGAGLQGINAWFTALICFFSGLIFIIIGGILGKHIYKERIGDYSWVRGGILILLALFHLLQ